MRRNRKFVCAVIILVILICRIITLWQTYHKSIMPLAKDRDEGVYTTNAEDQVCTVPNKTGALLD